MKTKFLAVVTVVAGITMASNTMAKTTYANYTAIQKEFSITQNDSTYDFGKVKENSAVSTTFTWKNNGRKPMAIKDVVTSCGCTSSNWDKKPILPGKTFSIAAIYNAASVGSFYKTITVILSNGQEKVFVITGEVTE